MNNTGEVIESAVETSPTIGAIAAALAKAQGAMSGAKKEAINPHFKSRYADLAAVWDAARAPLSANELAVVQMTEPGADGIAVITMLVHSSGEFFRSRLYTAGQMTVQQMGSAITYLRRYGLAAMVGVAPEDDDAEEAARSMARPANSQGAPKRTEAQAARDMRDLLAGAKSPPELDALWGQIERMPFGEAARTELRRDYEREMNARFPAKAAG